MKNHMEKNGKINMESGLYIGVIVALVRASCLKAFSVGVKA